MNNLQKYIHISKYARWIEKEKRRETWEETVHRYIQFFVDRNPNINNSGDSIWNQLQNSIENQEVMPSMRALMTAGKALERDNAAGYNCAGRAILHPRVFDELFYLLMCGCGVGFSVERQFINQMPEIADEFYDSDTAITVSDSKIGWASAFRELISLLYSGKVPKWDLSRVRPAGARLKTFGGRASGPGPLDQLFRYAVHVFKNAKGRKLNSIECHDMMCKIADTVIVGSVRRSACISFSNLTDDRLRRAKTGEWYLQTPHRALANNSVMYTEKPDLESFTKEFRSMYKSKAGERGMVNQEALMTKVVQCDRNPDEYYILNPCGEAILNAATGGLCNLTEVIIRSTDTLEDLKKKVKNATILGTLQSTLTKFRYLSKGWQRTAEEERLLGVSLTGIMDHPVMSGSDCKWKDEFGNPAFELFLGKEENCNYGLSNVLKELKQVAKKTNIEWAKKLGINPSKQLTLVKPSGTVSLLCDTSAGMHPRYSKFYIRRVTQDNKDPLTELMKSEGIPFQVHGEKTLFSFPVKAPENAITTKEMNAISQLELWKIYQQYWCDGNPSQTIYYTDDNFLDVQSWVWKNWDSIGGLSFFPVDDNVYDNNPYVPITEEEYEKLSQEFPKDIKWENLADFEKEDTTTSSQEFACSGGKCEL